MKHARTQQVLHKHLPRTGIGMIPASAGKVGRMQNMQDDSCLCKNSGLHASINHACMHDCMDIYDRSPWLASKSRFSLRWEAGAHGTHVADVEGVSQYSLRVPGGKPTATSAMPSNFVHELLLSKTPAFQIESSKSCGRWRRNPGGPR